MVTSALTPTAGRSAPWPTPPPCGSEQLHAQVDPLWQVGTRRQRKAARRHVYSWLGRILDLPGQDCHIGAMDAAACRRALELIAAHSYRRH
jgi:hypothetical protein